MIIDKAIIDKLKFITNEKGCWIFTSRLDKDDYGRKQIKGTTYRVHRLSASHFLGLDIDNGEQLALHKCRNKACFNPEHLYIGTYKDNMQDKIRDGTNHEINKKLCKKGHQLDGLNLSGWRYCMTCARNYQQKLRDDKKQNKGEL